MNEAERIRVMECGCRTDAPTGITTFFCAEHDPKRTKAKRKPRPLKTFHVYFAGRAACATIKAASAKEARTIAQDNYNRGELTEENGALRLLPEGRSIEVTFYNRWDWVPFIEGVEEEETA